MFCGGNGSVGVASFDPILVILRVAPFTASTSSLLSSSSLLSKSRAFS